jgi:hypothetical protein
MTNETTLIATRQRLIEIQQTARLLYDDLGTLLAFEKAGEAMVTPITASRLLVDVTDLCDRLEQRREQYQQDVGDLPDLRVSDGAARVDG